MPEKTPGAPIKRRMPEPQSRAVFLHGSDIETGDGSSFAVFEEKRTSTVVGIAYPTADSRSTAACDKALGITVECFLGRPSVADVAMQMIGQFVDDGISELQEKDKEFMCSLAALYIFKGKARVYPIGYTAVLFFEGEHKEIWYGDGVPAGKGSREPFELPGTLELDADCRFIFIAGCEMDTVKDAVKYFEESKGEDTEGMKAYFADKRASYINLYLPKREKRGFFR